MKQLIINLPDSVLATLNTSPDAFEREAQTAMAVKLFEMGRLTSGQAAKLAGLSRVQFLLTCQQYGTPSVAWDEVEMVREFGDMP